MQCRLSLENPNIQLSKFRFQVPSALSDISKSSDVAPTPPAVGDVAPLPADDTQTPVEPSWDAPEQRPPADLGKV